MSELNTNFSLLKAHFQPNLNWVDVEEWLSSDEESEEVRAERAQMFWALPMSSQEHRQQDRQLQALRDLAAVITSLRSDNQSSYDNTYDNWATIITVSPPDGYLAYIYALASLATAPAHVLQAAPRKLNEDANLQLSLHAVNTYLLTLTIPGAKSYGIFDEDVIEHCLRVFKLLEQNANRSVGASRIWSMIMTICDTLKLVFRYVHFKEHIKPRDKILRCLMEILYMNFKQGYCNPSAPALHAKCFELFDEIATEYNGDVYETLHLILRQTFPMHIYASSPRGAVGQGSDHISDWFIKLIGKFPDILSRILRFYIECVVSNPIKAWKSNDEKIAIGYAAKYDAALYAKCNESCVDYIIEAVKADDAVTIQTRALDLIDRILQQQTEVEWSIFRYEVSSIPREVALIRETILCLNDRTFTVRRKAAQVLISALKQGSPKTLRILDESIRFVQYDDEDVEMPPEPSAEQHELRFEKPGIVQYAFSFEGYDSLESEIKKLPGIIYERFLAADNGLSRTSGIALLERLVRINPLIIYNTNFVREFSLLSVDKLSSVRRSALESIESLLQTYCNCFELISVYCRIWACLLSDEDAALQKLALLSFNRNVLQNIQPLELSNEPKHFMPWRIVSTLLMSQPRAYLQERLGMLLEKEDMGVSLLLVDTIISHLSTSTATEAWALLLLISSRINNNMDALITHFHSLSSYNMKTNQLLALPLIISCLPNFSKAALNNLFKLLLEHLRSGNIWLGLISMAINLLKQMHHLSHSKSPLASPSDDSWLTELLHDVSDGIMSCASQFQEEHTRLQCLLGTYTEIIVMLPLEVDQRIVNIVFKYLKECTKLSEDNFDTDNERMMNWMIVIAGRLCLREISLANSLAAIYRQILSNNDRPQIINNTLIALNDLGKKHPTILESNFQCILGKLSSKFAMTRVRTFRCVKDVILAGNIKLKGPVLTSLLAALVDESSEVAREADAFFIRYQRLYNKLLFQHCLKECPFDLNAQPYLKGAATDARYRSPLRGKLKLRSRRLLYNHIIATLDDNTLLLYFGQLKVLAEKTKDACFVRSADALAVVVDMLFIMRRICYVTKGKRQQGARAEGENSDEEEERPEPPPAPAAALSQSEPAKGRGRAAKLREAQEEPLKQLERCLRYVEETHRHLSSVMDEQLQQSFDKLCKALAMRFPNYIDFAQPAKFWEKYRNAKATAKEKAKHRKRRRINEEGDDDAADELEEGESDTDNELPLEVHKAQTPAPRIQRTKSCDMILTELIFQPPDW